MMHGIYVVKLFRLNYATEKELLSEQIVIYISAVLSNDMVIKEGELGRPQK